MFTYLSQSNGLSIAPDDVAFNSSYDACRLSVDLSLKSTCDFSSLQKKAQKILEAGGKIFWQLEFDFAAKLSAFRFEGLLNAYHESLKLFSEFLTEEFKKHTLGVILYEGDADFTKNFAWSDGDVIEFKEWLTDLYKNPKDLFETSHLVYGLGNLSDFEEMTIEMFDITPFGRHLKNVFSLQVFSAYLHRLLAALTDELSAFIDIHHLESMHLGYLAQLFSKERLSHIELLSSIKNHQQECVVALCLPDDPFCLSSTLELFRRTSETLSSKKITFKIIPEFLMTASWEGIDKLLFIKKGLSPQGKRILQGFCVAGGVLVYVDEPVDLSVDQESLNDFLEGSG